MKMHSLPFSLDRADLKGKRVLLRVDLNVPVDEHGDVRDHERIVQVLPTINYILYSGARQVIMVSHHGRPHGKRDPRQSLRGVWRYFREMLAYDCHFVDDCMSGEIPERKLVLLENLRFHIGEEANDPEFARRLASYADIYVNDAFGSYQPHASVVGVPDYLDAYCGFLFQKEVQALSLDEIRHPLVFLLGGDKASTKLPIIGRISARADHVLIGGVLTFYFLKAMGVEIGKSKFSPEYVDHARRLLDRSNVVLPTDLIAATEPTQDAKTRVCAIRDIRPDEMGLDIGPETFARYKEILSGAGTIVWNGPMGLYEVEQFAGHTDGLARHMARLDATTIAGGGDSITVLNKLGLFKEFTYVSTGGGATLKFLEDGTLPALEALRSAWERRHGGGNDSDGESRGKGTKVSA